MDHVFKRDPHKNDKTTYSLHFGPHRISEPVISNIDWDMEDIVYFVWRKDEN